jgi:hypothetical protein
VVPLKFATTVELSEVKSFEGRNPRSTPVSVSLVLVKALPPPTIIVRVAEELPMSKLYVAPGQLVPDVPQFVKVSEPIESAQTGEPKTSTPKHRPKVSTRTFFNCHSPFSADRVKLVMAKSRAIDCPYGQVGEAVEPGLLSFYFNDIRVVTAA